MSQEKIRIAVCFSGQSRYWKQSMENIKLFFEHDYHPVYNLPVEVDYFIHTWNVNTWRFPKTHHTVAQNEYHNEHLDILESWKPVRMEFEPWIEKKFPRAWDSMFYSFAKSLMLKREYELQNNFQYDVVVKARLDVVFDPRSKFPLIQVEPKTCYSTQINAFPLEFNYNNFDDVMFFGSSPTMDLVGDLYHSYKPLHKQKNIEENIKNLNLDPTSYYGPGTLLYDHMVNLGIHPERVHHIGYAVMRNTCIHYNAITEYDELRATWLDWY